jgi:hypothetical protein
MKNEVETGIKNYLEGVLYGDIKEGVVHINPKTVQYETTEFKMEDLE